MKSKVLKIYLYGKIIVAAIDEKDRILIGITLLKHREVVGAVSQFATLSNDIIEKAFPVREMLDAFMQ